MSGFDDREKGFEAKFSHDEEVKFRIRAHRDKLLGLWAASQWGLHAAAAEAYANEVVAADIGHKEDELIAKLVADAKVRGKTLDPQLVRLELLKLGELARVNTMDAESE
jgi:hypothetical protein